MAARQELAIRARALGLDPTTIPNDSKLEQKILYLEKFGTTYTETLGTQTLTMSGVAVNGETITIGNRTYTWKTALTGVKASSTLTNATSFSNGETITISNKQYTMRTALTSPAQQNEILIGAAVTNSFDNIKSAINGTAGEGSTYSFGTTAHSDVTATTKTGTTLLVVARDFGTDANQLVTAETAATGAWTGSTLAGGVANVLNELKLSGVAATDLGILKDAVNNTGAVGVEGTDYSTGTPVHAQVTATTKTATTLLFVARNAAFDNASIATTETMANGAFGAATFAGGVRGVVALDATAPAGSAGISGDVNLL
jgi:hypothetical protein